jgi:hypothetical protein
MLSWVVVFALWLAGSFAQDAPRKIVEVTTAEEFASAIESPETTHIIVKKHLDLTGLPPDNTDQADRTEAVFYMPNNIASIRVRPRRNINVLAYICPQLLY